jgi:hypothetical protein
VKVKIHTLKTFKFVKSLKFGDNSLPTLIAIFGYPFIIKNNFNYAGNFYYIDSHYNRAIEYPTLKINIVELANIIAKELVSKLKNKEVILLGYSLGSVYAIELSKILQSYGIKTKLLFLIDPLDSVYNINNKKYNIFKYLIYNILLHIRHYLYKVIINIQTKLQICIIKHSTYINSIYRIHLLKYKFNKISINTILLKRKNNIPQTRYSINNIFNEKTLNLNIFNIKNHIDFFNNKKALVKWISILKNNI